MKKIVCCLTLALCSMSLWAQDAVRLNALKVQQARKERLDTLSSVRTRVQAYGRQLAATRIMDEAYVDDRARQLQRYAVHSSGAGSVQVSQIFFSLPQDASNQVQSRAKARMDSIYRALTRGADFEACVSRFSDDKQTTWYEARRLPKEVENVVFSLSPGQYSAPFYSPAGLHIVKVLQRKSPTLDDYRRRVVEEAETAGTGQPELSRLVERLKRKHGYQLDTRGYNELISRGATTQNLFTLGGRTYTGHDFAKFAATQSLGTRHTFDLFVTKSVFDHESSLLSVDQSAYAPQLQAYEDTLLLHEITYRKLEAPLHDRAALESYFKSHKNDYKWATTRFQGVVLKAADKKSLKKARKLVRSLPESEWENALRLMINTDAVLVTLEKGVFTPGQNAFVDQKIFHSGTAIPDVHYPYWQVVGKKSKAPETLDAVEAEVTRDFRAYLVRKWDKELGLK